MPEKKTLRRAQKDKSPATKDGEFVREEIEHVREGKHGARSAKQAIAIGLSKARRAGVKIPPPPGKKARQAHASASVGQASTPAEGLQTRSESHVAKNKKPVPPATKQTTY
jgi:hypothetical protein